MNSALAVTALVKREIVRFLRQRSRVVGALGTPLVFWFLIGSGIGSAFQSNYLHYFFPGTLVLILLFTAIFSTISIIEDRQEGFLQGVLVSSASRSTIVLGKLIGGTVLALGQGILFMLLLPLLKISIGIPNFLFILAVMTVMSFGLTGLGFVIAWRINSTQGFHAIMNLFLMPMWFLSGALFPLNNVPLWLKVIMMANPLTYSLAALHRGFFLGFGPELSVPSLSLSIGVTVGFSILMFVMSVQSIKASE